jgi:hypothetical protein
MIDERVSVMQQATARQHGKNNDTQRKKWTNQSSVLNVIDSMCCTVFWHKNTSRGATAMH